MDWNQGSVINEWICAVNVQLGLSVLFMTKIRVIHYLRWYVFFAQASIGLTTGSSLSRDWCCPSWSSNNNNLNSSLLLFVTKVSRSSAGDTFRVSVRHSCVWLEHPCYWTMDWCLCRRFLIAFLYSLQCLVVLPVFVYHTYHNMNMKAIKQFVVSDTFFFLEGCLLPLYVFWSWPCGKEFSLVVRYALGETKRFLLPS